MTSKSPFLGTKLLEFGEDSKVGKTFHNDLNRSFWRDSSRLCFSGLLSSPDHKLINGFDQFNLLPARRRKSGDRFEKTTMPAGLRGRNGGRNGDRSNYGRRVETEPVPISPRVRPDHDSCDNLGSAHQQVSEDLSSDVRVQSVRF